MDTRSKPSSFALYVLNLMLIAYWSLILYSYVLSLEMRLVPVEVIKIFSLIGAYYFTKDFINFRKEIRFKFIFFGGLVAPLWPVLRHSFGLNKRS